MAISDKIKALLRLKGKNYSSLAEYLGMSSQALSNKFYRDSYSGEDLIRISKFLDCDLAIIIDDAQKIILDETDLHKQDEAK